MLYGKYVARYQFFSSEIKSGTTAKNDYRDKYLHIILSIDVMYVSRNMQIKSIIDNLEAIHLFGAFQSFTVPNDQRNCSIKDTL